MDYLSEEEQYKRTLSQEEISRIKNWELRQIRSRYWGKKHQAHLDEHNIPDHEVEEVWRKIEGEEQVAIEEWKKRQEHE